MEWCGYVFKNSRITGNPTADSFYLGRPWRPYAQVVFMNSYLGDHIRTEGWHNWSDPANEKTAFYAEYNNEGPGAASGDWSYQLIKKQAEKYTLDKIFGDWNPKASDKD